MDDRTPPDRDELERAVVAQESLRGVVPDAVVDAAVAAIRRQMETATDELQRRRQVTVMFADVSGFTSMSSRSDPEHVADTMNELWSSLDSVITEHGGTIDKHIGDAVMAVWGATSTKEDDPERAVLAGLALQDRLRLQPPVDGLALRVGINTGPVHLGAVGETSEHTVIGDTVNVASRVQSFAPLGGVLVTHDTYRHIRGVFDVEEAEPANVKGKDEPIRVYTVRRAKARAVRVRTRGVEGVETQMIGRTRELDLLKAEFQRVVDEAATRRVTIVGDAGIGKSRLLYELENWIELHKSVAYFFMGRAVATHRSVAFGLVRNLLGDRFGVLERDSSATVAAKLRASLSPALTADEADLVGHWLGFDLRSSPAVRSLLGSGQLASAARAHLFRYLEVLASDAVVVLFLEDLHWADDESLNLIDDLVGQVVAAHVLVVGVTRPTLTERAPATPWLRDSSTVVRLDPLDADSTRALAAEVLQKADRVPDALTDLIVGRADGNAFYVEELVKMLIDDGVIDTETRDAWRVRIERLDAARVPATLTGVLQARLDGLAAPERQTLQRSSVVGRVFWDATVAVIGDDDIANASRSLDAARRRELVFRRERSSFDDSVEYVFKHALFRDVAYETVLLRDRRRLHRLVAEWVHDHAGDRLTEHAALIATHYRLAGDFARAGDLLLQVAVASLEAGEAAGARRNLDEAFDLWRQIGQVPSVDALVAMTEACLQVGDLDAAFRHDEDALRLAATAEARALALFHGSWIAAEQGRHDDEKAMLDEVLPEAERQGGRLLVRTLSGLAWWSAVQGDLGAANAYGARASGLARDLDDRISTREVLAVLTVISSLEGDLEASLRHSVEALGIAVGVGDLEGQAHALHNIGVSYHLLADASGERDHFLAALEHYDRAKELSRRLGRRLQEGNVAANMGQIHIRLGEDAEARRLIGEGFVVAREIGATTSLTFCVLAEADRRLTNGDAATALELIGLVQRHPALSSQNTDEIERILARSGLRADDIARGVAPNDGDNFDRVVDRLTKELTTG